MAETVKSKCPACQELFEPTQYYLHLQEEMVRNQVLMVQKLDEILEYTSLTYITLTEEDSKNVISNEETEKEETQFVAAESQHPTLDTVEKILTYPANIKTPIIELDSTKPTLELDSTKPTLELDSTKNTVYLFGILNADFNRP
jgi:hypothetical protein